MEEIERRIHGQVEMHQFCSCPRLRAFHLDQFKIYNYIKRYIKFEGERLLCKCVIDSFSWCVPFILHHRVIQKTQDE